MSKSKGGWVVVRTSPDGVHEIDSRHRTKAAAKARVEKDKEEFGTGWSWKAYRMGPRDGFDPYAGSQGDAITRGVE